MRKASYYLLLDRSDPKQPRWVVAKECRIKPAEVPDGLDHPEGTKWLRGFSGHEFEWLKRIFGRPMALRMTKRGEECFATRIADHGGIWTEYVVEVDPERWTHDSDG